MWQALLHMYRGKSWVKNMLYCLELSKVGWGYFRHSGFRSLLGNERTKWLYVLETEIF